MSAFWILRARLIVFIFGFIERVISVASLGKVGGNIATKLGLLEEEKEQVIELEEEEAMGLVMVKISGMVLRFRVMIFIVGRERRLGIILSFPLI